MAHTTSTVGAPVFRFFAFSPPDSVGQQDTDSDVEYGPRYAPSVESLGPSRMGMPEAGTPYTEYAGAQAAREPYPAWSTERQIPLSKEEIEDIFLDLAQKFGFQRDSMRNMVGSSWLRPPFTH